MGAHLRSFKIGNCGEGANCSFSSDKSESPDYDARLSWVQDIPDDVTPLNQLFQQHWHSEENDYGDWRDG